MYFVQHALLTYQNTQACITGDVLIQTMHVEMAKCLKTPDKYCGLSWEELSVRCYQSFYQIYLMRLS